MRLCWAILLLGLSGCSPSPRTIARIAAEGSGGGAGSGAAASAGSDGGPAPLALGRRGRAQVVDGELVSDVGTPLRGALMPVDVGFQLESLELVGEMSQSAGLNTLHVYLENSDQETGLNRDRADALVALAASAGLYVILGIGGGAKNGSFDLDKVKAFWSLYGPRYAEQTHVLFEIQNNPELTCEDPVRPATLALEQALYEYLRGVAPQTHVVFFSGSSLIRPAVLSDLIERLAPFADFSNTSIALHTDQDCTPLAELESLHTVAQAAQVPLLLSQLPRTGWQPYVEALEQLHISWLHHYYLGSGTVAELIAATSSAGLSWCPDYGTFPQDSSQCAKP